MQDQAASPPSTVEIADLAAKSFEFIEKHDMANSPLGERLRSAPGLWKEPPHFVAMLPLLSQQIIEESRTGVLYREPPVGLNQEGLVYVVLPQALAMDLVGGVQAELVNSEGRSIASWVVWEHSFSEVLVGPDVAYLDSPKVDREELMKPGMTLSIYLGAAGGDGLVARLPLYPIRE